MGSGDYVILCKIGLDDNFCQGKEVVITLLSPGLSTALDTQSVFCSLPEALIYLFYCLSACSPLNANSLKAGYLLYILFSWTHVASSVFLHPSDLAILHGVFQPNFETESHIYPQCLAPSLPP